MEESFYDNDFTEDEIACLKKMVYKFRQDEILELYKKSTSTYTMLQRQYKATPEEFMKSPYRTTVSGCLTHAQVPKPKSFLVKVKDFFKKWYGMVW
jgi:hypothetical protein